jgi:cytochrome P450
MLVVADVLGVPEADHQRFREFFGLSASPGEVGGDADIGLNALGGLDDWFATYIEDRRREPRDDVLTRLALGTYPDGTTPEVTRWCGRRRSSSRRAGDDRPPARRRPEVPLRVPRAPGRASGAPDRIPDFIEESLRIESPVKSDFRLARRSTTVAGVDIAAGTPVMLLNGAANRDPRQFECPAEFRLDRPNAKVHMAFGRGVHSCPGGPLARVEGRVSIERILDRMRDIRLSEEHHGPPSARHFEYEPTWVLRGLHKLHIEFTPAEASR